MCLCELPVFWVPAGESLVDDNDNATLLDNDDVSGYEICMGEACIVGL